MVFCELNVVKCKQGSLNFHVPTRVAFRTQSNIYDGAFCKNTEGHSTVYYFHKMLQLKYLGFWMRLSSPCIKYADRIIYCKLSGICKLPANY